MKCESAELETTFELPDPEAATMRQILRWDSQIEGRMSGELYERLWNAAVSCGAVSAWKSAPVPVLAAEALDAPYQSKAFEVVKWAALQVFSWAQAVKELAAPKNS